ncbi:PEP-CTERM sorting domain-containing protein [Massilia pseudoviolaceinigra]|uniref:PEP-CTERM sorting domain-containing protein n=1 Tax=Massilia pseudoviolaceinigra TaxID=3057165 RepID=UPI00279668BA|nr:PEP-CTERM sorting domain-containing protein [Massilia sp. CCM 9206]MDQ1924034.1 PEP-CTERM sorting domain-containing protein [Massilia sp. CCM 9206]
MKYIAAAITALVLTVPAQAALQVYEFTASVSGLGDVRALTWAQSVSGRQEGSVISLGDRIVGRFAYDTTAKSTFNSGEWFPNPDTNTYFYSSAPSPANFFTFTILPSGHTVRVGDANAPVSSMSFTDGKPNIANMTDVLSFRSEVFNGESNSLNFTGSTANWVSNGGLPGHLSMADMGSASLHHDYYKPGGGRILLNATITSLNEIAITPVPEPGTWAMLLAGLTILGFSARRKRN